MNKKYNNKKPQDEIDVFIFLKLLIESKKIILLSTAIIFILTLLFHINTPNNYQLTISFKKTKEENLYDINRIDKNLEFKQLYSLFDGFHEENNNISLPEENKNINPKNSEKIFNAFIYNLYEEENIIGILEKTRNIDSLKKTDLNFASVAQQIVYEIPKGDQDTHKLIINWPVKKEISTLTEQIFLTTLTIVKKDLIKELDLKVDQINNEYLSKTNEINRLKQIILENSKNSIKVRLGYLEDQLKIAEKLGIEGNNLRSEETIIFNQDDIQSHSYDYNYPYYLRGMKSIKQEISNLYNLSEDEIGLSEDRFNKLEQELKYLKFQYESFIEMLNKDINIIQNADPTNWLNYNLSLSKIINTKNTHILLILSIFVGLLLSAFFVLVIEGIRKTFRNIY